MPGWLLWLLAHCWEIGLVLFFVWLPILYYWAYAL